ncbi:hypothetical protein F7725_002814 [Dissostichus mawsoni]|uniref:Uncharacterized protein n=1 Tax=Dissostichus mawsoni TaxID=36200 RepID=A0A7J5Y8E5_DISMA|nr:hypothetical protein F7725_002814 [Dissostichus mawsoni]
MEELCSVSDWNLTWYTSRPDLTKCFQHTVLVWFPCVYLWTCFSSLPVVPAASPTPRGHPAVQTLLQQDDPASVAAPDTYSGLFWLLEMFYVLVKKNEEIHNHLLILMGPLIRSLTLVLAVVIIQVERIKAMRSSVLLFLFWTLLVLCSLVPLKVDIEQIIEQGFSSDAVRFVAFFICFSLQLIELILSCFSDHQPLSEKHTYIQAADLWPLQDQNSSIEIMTDLEKFCTQNCKQLQYDTLHLGRSHWPMTAWEGGRQRGKPKEGTRAGRLTRRDGETPVRQAVELREEPANSGLSWSRRSGSDLPTEKTQLLRRSRKGEGNCIFLMQAMGRRFGMYFLRGTLLLLGFMRDRDCHGKGFLYAALLFLLSCLHGPARQQCTMGEIINLVSADTQKLILCSLFQQHLDHSNEITLCFYFLWQLLGCLLSGYYCHYSGLSLNGFIAKMRSRLQV